MKNYKKSLLVKAKRDVILFSGIYDMTISVRKDDIGLMIFTEDYFYYFIRNNFGIRYLYEASIISNFFDNVFLKIG